MKKQKWVFDQGNSRIVTEDDTINVLYTDRDEELSECPDVVFETVVKLHNNNINGFHLGSEGSIDLYLLNESLCSQEARELICEELFKNYYSKL